MNASRMARCIAVSVAAALGGVGCDAQPRESAVADADPQLARSTARTDPARAAGRRDQPPKPDITRLSFDPATRTLRLYPLADKSARWMLKLPTSPAGVPVEAAYQFPMDLDLDPSELAVYYTLPNQRPSSAVSLQDVMDAHGVRARR